jgi:hypothetical protein
MRGLPAETLALSREARVRWTQDTERAPSATGCFSLAAVGHSRTRGLPELYGARKLQPAPTVGSARDEDRER